MNKINLMQGDCLERMAQIPDNSIDAIVTDPPYGLSFMGKKWDYDVPSVKIWQECLRVLKPGGHLLAFAGTRTQHRMAVRIEDAGFEIRDLIAWVYGSGFPKSHDVSKAIDKVAGATREVVGRAVYGDGHVQNSAASIGFGGCDPAADSRAITAPATEAARQWAGWGTALKPALEPITVARKPLVGTVAENVLAHGAGGLNIDGCRVESGGDVCGTSKSHSTPQDGWDRPWRHDEAAAQRTFQAKQEGNRKAVEMGRWPANLIHDGSDEVLAGFPQTAPSSATLHPGTDRGSQFGQIVSSARTTGYSDTGSAARFFYCAKASKRDRDEGLEEFEVKRTGAMQATADGSMLTGSGNERTTARANNHPTVKPTDLMRYLCRLVTPPSGTVLDPFMGSGSTGKAAMLEGFQFIGIERDPDYFKIAEARINNAKAEKLLI